MNSGLLKLLLGLLPRAGEAAVGLLRFRNEFLLFSEPDLDDGDDDAATDDNDDDDDAADDNDDNDAAADDYGDNDHCQRPQPLHLAHWGEGRLGTRLVWRVSITGCFLRNRTIRPHLTQ